MMNLSNGRASTSGSPYLNTSFASQLRVFLDSIERKNWEGRVFYHENDIRRWMLDDKTLDPDESMPNLDFLWRNSYIHQFSPLGIDANRIAEQALLVFTMLHCLNHGRAIESFLRHKIDDHKLRALPENIEHDLRGGLGPEGVSEKTMEDFLQRFEELRWSFFPARIEYSMDDAYFGHQFILPFVTREPVNTKGGTANVHRCQIQQNLIDPSSELHHALQDSLHETEEWGKCYHLAIKSYHRGSKSSYDLEIAAFKGCNAQAGIVKYLGQYVVHNHHHGNAYHIILEYGERDLDEYLADTYPPVMFDEILATWEDIFSIARTTQDLHALEHEGQKYRGWHGDIKPDNILRVHGKLKLADFGFARFESNTQLSTHMSGGTHTYGAPECDPVHQKTSSTHLQSIDTWSLCCVLSSVATWVILGSRAYDEYVEYRRKEIEGLRELKKEKPATSVPTADDAFHDGTRVLKAVSRWHQYLRNSKRVCDTISGHVLDLVEECMLLPTPQERWNPDQLCKRLDLLVEKAKNEHKQAILAGAVHELAKETIQTLLDFEKEAPYEPTRADELQAKSSSSRDTVAKPNKSHRVNKSKPFVLAKMANREQVLETTLEESEDSETPLSVSPSFSHMYSGDRKGKRVNSLSTRDLDNNNPLRIVNGASTRINNYMYQDSQNAHPQQRNLDTVRERSMALINMNTNNQTQYLHDLETSQAAEPLHSAPFSATQGLRNSHTQYKPRATGSSHQGSLFIPRIMTGTHRTPVTIPRSVSKFSATHISDEYLRWQSDMRSSTIFSNLSLFSSKIPVDERLQKYIIDRDFIFLIDNGASMKVSWEVATKVCVALAMKIGRLDEDGLDLMFALGGKHNVHAKGWKIFKSFTEAFDKVRKVILDDDKTNMAEALEKIFDAYDAKKKRLTLIILTTGDWAGEPDNVEKLVAEFLTRLKTKLKKLEKRWFTIQFVAFGKEMAHLQRLQDLDDLLAAQYNVDDVIDTKPWDYHDVDMLIRGSLTEEADAPQVPSSSQIMTASPVAYDGSSGVWREPYYGLP